MASSLLLSTALLLLLTFTVAEIESETVGISLPKVSWKQTAADLSLSFEAPGFENFFYNTTTTNEKSVVRLMFQNGTSQQFLRLHLAAAVVPDATTAEAEESGARLNLKKVEGSLWDSAILFATPTPLVASVDIKLPDERLQKVQASEFGEVPEAVKVSLKEAGVPVEGNEAGIAGIASTLSNAISLAVPTCHQELFCTCSAPLVFDGLECIDGTTWTSRDIHVTSPSAMPFPGRQNEFLSAQQLLNLSDDDFVLVFDSFRNITRTATWPSTTYAQSFAGRRVLVAGAGLQTFETLVLAQMGAQLTFVDHEAANLKLVERVVGLSGLPAGNIRLLHATSLESLAALPTNFDAVVAIHSLTEAPAEMVRGVYAALLQRLRIGGRWVQTAASKAAYVAAGRPSLAGALRPLGLTTPPSQWSDWLDLPKLLNLFPQAAFELILRHQNEFSFFVDLRLEERSGAAPGGA